MGWKLKGGEHSMEEDKCLDDLELDEWAGEQGHFRRMREATSFYREGGELEELLAVLNDVQGEA